MADVEIRFVSPIDKHDKPLSFKPSVTLTDRLSLILMASLGR